jgi:hypothetical protein
MEFLFYLLFLTPTALTRSQPKEKILGYHCNRIKHFTFPAPPAGEEGRNQSVLLFIGRKCDLFQPGSRFIEGEVRDEYGISTRLKEDYV